MVNTTMETEKPDPVNVQTCEYFVHKLNPHIHECTNKKNMTKRCGFDIAQLKACPLLGKIVKKAIRPTKPVTSQLLTKSEALKEADNLTKASKPEVLAKTPDGKAKAELNAPDVQEGKQTVAPQKAESIDVTNSRSSELSNPKKSEGDSKIQDKASSVAKPVEPIKKEKLTQEQFDKIDAIEEKSEHRIGFEQAKATVLSQESKKEKVKRKKEIIENVKQK